MKYRLEIHAPGTTGNEMVATMESASPFPTIAAGDLITPIKWEDPHFQAFTDKGWELIRVVNVLHMIGKAVGEDCLCTLQIYTENVPDTEETRLTRWTPPRPVTRKRSKKAFLK